MATELNDYVTGGEGSNAPAVPSGIAAPAGGGPTARSLLERACETFAAITEVERAEQGREEVAFWHGATDDQRESTMASVLWLLEGHSVEHWDGRDRAERVRSALLRVVGGPDGARACCAAANEESKETAAHAAESAAVIGGVLRGAVAAAERECHAARRDLHEQGRRISSLYVREIELLESKRQQRLFYDARIAELEAAVAAQAQEIGRLRATDAGAEIAPGVRLVWQRGDVGVLTFEPGATVPEESHERDEVGVVIGGGVAVCPALGSPRSWFVPAREPHTMTAGPEGAIVGVRWVSAKPDHDVDREARLTRTERAANPLMSYMPIDGLSTEAMVDGLRGMAMRALRSLKGSGRRAVGLKLIITEEP